MLEWKIIRETNTDIKKVKNYMGVLNAVKERLARIPIGTRIVLELHEIILKDYRERNKRPGNREKRRTL